MNLESCFCASRSKFELVSLRAIASVLFLGLRVGESAEHPPISWPVLSSGFLGSPPNQ